MWLVVNNIIQTKLTTYFTGQGAQCCPEGEGSKNGWCYCPEYTEGDPYEECQPKLTTFGAGFWASFLVIFGLG